MNINERVTVDGAELFSYIESKLDRLKPFIYDSRYRTLLGGELTDKLSRWDKNIRSQKDVPLTVVVCGEFKRGKSSLINALLGEDTVTTDITTETITVNRISYGEHSNEIVLKGGKRLKLTDDELKCDKLKNIIAELPENERITVLELKRPLGILKEMTVIDTPGLGDSMKDFTAETEYALKQADAVIYVFSVSYPLSVQEQFFIRTAVKPQKYTDLFLVGNYCDTVGTREELERLEKTICERIGGILPGESPFMLSALDERCRQKGKRPPNEELSPFLSAEFDRFRTEINGLIASKKDLVIPDRMQRMLAAMTDEIEADIKLLSDGLSAAEEELNRKKEEVGEAKRCHNAEKDEFFRAVDKKAEEYRARAIDWITEFTERMEKDTDNLSALPIADIKQYYPLFCIDTLQAAADRCGDYFLKALYDDVETISLEAAKRLSMKAEEKKTVFGFRSSSQAWTKGDNLEFFNDAMQSTLGISSIILTFTAGVMRESEIKKSAPDTVKSIKAQYPQLKTSVITAVSENYLKIAENVKKQLEEYFDEKKNELEAQLEQTEMIVRQDGSKKREIGAAANELLAVINDIREEL